ARTAEFGSSIDAFTVDLESFVSCFAAAGKASASASASAARTVIARFIPLRDILFLLGVIRPLQVLRRIVPRAESNSQNVSQKKLIHTPQNLRRVKRGHRYPANDQCTGFLGRLPMWQPPKIRIGWRCTLK